ncbi:MAG: cysteine hydrolase [Desulfohalobiaceae bacterium]|nr:cysteine hydrolase [Desulfohalobiaceae bacterium]
MNVHPQERPALLVIDMVKDNFDPAKNLPITEPARATLGPINHLSRIFRQQNWPVIFATDAFQPDDFIFQSRMKPHSLAGTPGAEVLEELERTPADLWLPKPRFSAFFDTDLASRLQRDAVTLCAVAGIATHFCVLTTALDAVCHDFKAVLLEDCSADYSAELHEKTLSLYRRNPLQPLLRVMRSEEFVQEYQG